MLRVSGDEVLLPILTFLLLPVRKSRIQLHRDLFSPRVWSFFPLFRRRFLGSDRAAQTKGSDAVSVNKAPAFKNSKSGLHCAMKEPMFNSVCLCRQLN